MKRIPLLGLIALSGWSHPLSAQTVEPEASRVHVVRPGDTLWDLARYYLLDPYLWPAIHSLNRDQVPDPHWIFPLERLRIPGAAVQHSFGPTEPHSHGAETSGIGARTVFFDHARAEPSGSAAAPSEAIRARSQEGAPVVPRALFHSAGRLVSDSELSIVGQLIGPVAPSPVGSRFTPQIQPYDLVELRVSGDLAPGDRVQLLRPVRRLEPYGRIFLASGSARILEIADGTARAEVDFFYDRVEVGDLAVPFPVYEVPGGAPVAAEGVQGTLLAFAHPQPLPAQDDIAFVNVGRASGVREGDEFLAYRRGGRPMQGAHDVEIARLQVIRADASTSAVRVLELRQPALEAGLPIRLIARMP